MGETVFELPLIVPIPWLIEVVEALLADQDKTELPPELMEEGLAVKNEIAGAGAEDRAKVVKVKSGEVVELFKLSIEVTLK